MFYHSESYRERRYKGETQTVLPLSFNLRVNRIKGRRDAFLYSFLYNFFLYDGEFLSLLSRSWTTVQS